MNRDESIKLWQQGRDAWNEWAEKMLAERKALEEAGEWQAEEGFFGNPIEDNTATYEWIAKARADFSDLRLRADGQAEGGTGKEIKGQRESVLLGEDIVDFSELIFPSHVSFKNTIFDCGDAVFNKTQFRGDTSFFSTQFHDDAIFWQTQFHGNAGFKGTQFRGIANFNLVQFNGNAYFWAPQFHGYAHFGEMQFRGDAVFALAHFEKPVSFRQAQFKKSAHFSSITSKKSFNLFRTRFALVPDFTETAFHAPPVLDDMEIAQPLQRRKWPLHIHTKDNLSPDIRPADMQGWKLAQAADEARKYRALAKMAGEAKDYHNEMEFFSSEQRCRRFWHDRPVGKNMGRFWLGWLYDKLSNYGRSFARPFMGWLATVAVFAFLYAGGAAKPLTSWLDPVFLSLRHGLIISGLSRNGHLADVLERIYGGNLPGPIALAMLAQPLISAIWLFLLLLALRNQFKIK